MDVIKDRILPAFPRTKHLCSLSKASSDDLIATAQEYQDFMSTYIFAEEKVDGANCGVTWYQNNLVIRNRRHVLSKNYTKDTPAKKQFVPLWTWAYDNKNKFNYLKKQLGFMPSVYGEWVYARHTLGYDKLPDWFIAYDIWSTDDKCFINPDIAKPLLINSGLVTTTTLMEGYLDIETILKLMFENSLYASAQTREGVYLRNQFGDRYKMVNSWFEPNTEWVHGKTLIRNIKG